MIKSEENRKRKCDRIYGWDGDVNVEKNGRKNIQAGNGYVWKKRSVR